jgi:hypothetical protein
MSTVINTPMLRRMRRFGGVFFDGSVLLKEVGRVKGKHTQTRKEHQLDVWRNERKKKRKTKERERQMCRERRKKKDVPTVVGRGV